MVDTTPTWETEDIRTHLTWSWSLPTDVWPSNLPRERNPCMDTQLPSDVPPHLTTWQGYTQMPDLATTEVSLPSIEGMDTGMVPNITTRHPPNLHNEVFDAPLYAGSLPGQYVYPNSSQPRQYFNSNDGHKLSPIHSMDPTEDFAPEFTIEPPIGSSLYDTMVTSHAETLTTWDALSREREYPVPTTGFPSGLEEIPGQIPSQFYFSSS